MSHEPILFKDIDEPGLRTLEVYRRRGGYEMVSTALARLCPPDAPSSS